MKINILEPEVYNRIAAGEVVERPTSVVKELVENAIDAGANSVTIRIEEGGIKRIEIEDDGVGIPKEELPKTIIPHATSKITDADDLFSISTLGFRGEALASISAVSEFSICSRHFESELGCTLTMQGGRNLQIKDAPRNEAGTTVTVSKLFYNTPARYKFLKTKKTEENYVSALVNELILANPQVAISYYIDGKFVTASDGNGMLSAVNAVFPREIAEEMLPVMPNENSNIQVSGFAAKASCTKHTREFQTTIVNGRVISDANISAAVQNAYGERLMQRQFPIFVLNVLVPFESVDVNVHPNKREVRFENTREVFGAIYNAVKMAIDDYEFNQRRAILKAEIEDKPQKTEEMPNNSTTKGVIEEILPSSFADGAIKAEEVEKKDDNLSLGDMIGRDIPKILKIAETDYSANIHKSTPEEISESIQRIKNRNLENKINNLQNSKAKHSVMGADAFLHSLGLDHILADNKNEEKPPRNENENTCENSENQEKTAIIKPVQAQIDCADCKNYTIIGQAFNTYLIVEVGKKLVLIDQHAAHERLLYDEYMESVNSGVVAVQSMLIPYIYNTSPMDMARISEMMPALKQMGFEIEEFGRNCLRINAVPTIIADVDLDKFFADLLSKEGNLPKIGELIKDKLATAACKAAIKGGDSMNESQIAAFIARLENGNMPLSCPHGRPTYIIYTQNDLEKAFKRKV